MTLQMYLETVDIFKQLLVDVNKNVLLTLSEPYNESQNSIQIYDTYCKMVQTFKSLNKVYIDLDNIARKEAGKEHNLLRFKYTLVTRALFKFVILSKLNVVYL